MAAVGEIKPVEEFFREAGEPERRRVFVDYQKVNYLSIIDGLFLFLQRKLNTEEKEPGKSKVIIRDEEEVYANSIVLKGGSVLAIKGITEIDTPDIDIEILHNPLTVDKEACENFGKMIYEKMYIYLNSLGLPESEGGDYELMHDLDQGNIVAGKIFKSDKNKNVKCFLVKTEEDGELKYMKINVGMRIGEHQERIIEINLPVPNKKTIYALRTIPFNVPIENKIYKINIYTPTNRYLIDDNFINFFSRLDSILEAAKKYDAKLVEYKVNPDPKVKSYINKFGNILIENKIKVKNSITRLFALLNVSGPENKKSNRKNEENIIYINYILDKFLRNLEERFKSGLEASIITSVTDLIAGRFDFSSILDEELKDKMEDLFYMLEIHNQSHLNGNINERVVESIIQKQPVLSALPGQPPLPPGAPPQSLQPQATFIPIQSFAPGTVVMIRQPNGLLIPYVVNGGKKYKRKTKSINKKQKKQKKQNKIKRKTKRV